MALSSQFSLSVELTKLVPFGSLVTASGQALLNLMRDLQETGSDLVTEEGLALVFGRNRIDPRFETSFRTAVRESVIHHVTDIAELMIQGGPGPTLQRSLSNTIYFRTVVQLSLLTWAHEIGEFAKALSQALDRRATETGQQEAPPRLDGLKGTLRAVREQTCGYMWELTFSAVDLKLAPLRGANPPSHSRFIPISILQGLLDSLTAVQHLPEARLIRIRSIDGATTIVVWAHHVLGLTVLVESALGSERFGDGPETVYIDCTALAGDVLYPEFEAHLSLFNETDDLLFTIEQASDDFFIEPWIRHHPVYGFGYKIIEMRQDYDVVIQHLIYASVTSALAIVAEESTQKSDPLHRRGQDVYPSVQKILTVGRLLFPSHAFILDSLDVAQSHQCLARSPWTIEILPEPIADLIKDGHCSLKDFRAETRCLTETILVLSLVQNIENCLALPLDHSYVPKHTIRFSMAEQSRLGQDEFRAQELAQWISPLPMPTSTTAFRVMVEVLKGKDFRTPERHERQVSVISTGGWTLCLGSIIENDPSDLHPSIVVLQGVPMRKGERRRLITDIPPREDAPQYHTSVSERKKELSKYRIFAKPGERKKLRTWTRSKKTRHLIATTVSRLWGIYVPFKCLTP